MTELSADVRARLASLAAAHRLGARQQEQLARLLQLLAEDRQAPTSVRAPEQALDVHLADSLVALDLPALQTGGAIVDIGAGAGFPGLALAVALPASEVALLESNARKCAFIERALPSLELANAVAVPVRAEEWQQGVAAENVALARAVAPQPVVLEYAAPLLRIGGALIDWRGRRVEADEQAGLRAAELLGLERTEVRRVRPYPAAREHHLHVFVKRTPTPERFPRRTGVARKRPLG